MRDIAAIAPIHRGSLHRAPACALLAAAVAIGAWGCASHGRGARRPVSDRLEASGIEAMLSAAEPAPESLDGTYNAAVRKSAVFLATNQDSNLWPVSGSTAVGSLASCNCPGKRCSKGCSFQPGMQTLPTDIWVSPSAQLAQFCAGFSSDLTAEQVVLKLQQLQGLPPRTGQDPCTWKILQFTVDDPAVPDQFFRPCPNPDPTTTGPCPASFDDSDPQATPDFRAWMAGQAFLAWKIPHGYPWTHLGYTYNWDPQAASIHGTSEYVMRAGSTVEVTGVVSAVELCTLNRLTCP
jgi:hypothetical protein